PSEGIIEGEGAEGEEGEGMPSEGLIEGEESEGMPSEGLPEEGQTEGITEGSIEGEGISEGEGQIEYHTADQNGDHHISLCELLRVIQLYNIRAYHCQAGTEDGYAPGAGEDHACIPHASDYKPQDWYIGLLELLRLIQFYNSGGYHLCEGSEDGFCPGP
ncbi:MAG TPA: hypothetical protein PLI09_17305, partial [Candidatus Hydrogenedentes bacterium]|nr:hypothetical protein [Candidatus Hydrogenedentota bacterium]